jgi:5-methylcytosine-specific restriction endonuclease McrA
LDIPVHPNYLALLADERREMATGTLLLNASYEPLRVITLKRGINLVLANKAEILEESDDEYVRSQRMVVKAPSVIRLLRFVKVPYRSELPLTRKNLYARDKGKCAYCKKHVGTKAHESTRDHVHPRSRGGLDVWENVVLSCPRCNQLKKDKTLEELGWKLDFVPKAPKGLVWFVVGIEVDPAWEPYPATA